MADICYMVVLGSESVKKSCPNGQVFSKRMVAVYDYALLNRV